MPNVTTVTGAVHIDEVWSPELNRAVQHETVIAATFEDKSSQMPHGDVYHLPARHNLTANTKSAGVDLTPEAITETEQAFTVSTHQAIAQTIEDIAEIQSKYDLRAETTKAGAYALARAMDVAAANLFDDNTVQTVGVLGSELTYDNLLRARQYMRDSSSKGEQTVFVPPATFNGLLKIEQFTNQLYTGDEQGRAIHEAQVGKIFKSTVYESNLLPGSAPSAYGHWYAKGHFFKIVQRQPTTHTWYSPLAVAWVVTMDQLYGVFERQEADEAAAATTVARLWGVRLQCAK